MMCQAIKMVGQDKVKVQYSNAEHKKKHMTVPLSSLYKFENIMLPDYASTYVGRSSDERVDEFEMARPRREGLRREGLRREMIRPDSVRDGWKRVRPLTQEEQYVLYLDDEIEGEYELEPQLELERLKEVRAALTSRKKPPLPTLDMLKTQMRERHAEDREHRYEMEVLRRQRRTKRARRTDRISSS